MHVQSVCADTSSMEHGAAECDSSASTLGGVVGSRCSTMASFPVSCNPGSQSCHPALCYILHMVTLPHCAADRHGLTAFLAAGGVRQPSPVCSLLLQLHSHHHHDLAQPFHGCSAGKFPSPRGTGRVDTHPCSLGGNPSPPSFPSPSPQTPPSITL